MKTEAEIHEYLASLEQQRTALLARIAELSPIIAGATQATYIAAVDAKRETENCWGNIVWKNAQRAALLWVLDAESTRTPPHSAAAGDPPEGPK